MSVCKYGLGETSADADFGALPGLELQHDLYLTVRDWTDGQEVWRRLAHAGADLQSLQISRQEEVFSLRCRIKRVSSDAARSLCASLRDDGVAQNSSVEHLMLARSQARAP